MIGTRPGRLSGTNIARQRSGLISEIQSPITAMRTPVFVFTSNWIAAAAPNNKGIQRSIRGENSPARKDAPTKTAVIVVASGASSRSRQNRTNDPATAT